MDKMSLRLIQYRSIIQRAMRLSYSQVFLHEAIGCFEVLTGIRDATLFTPFRDQVASRCWFSV